MSAVHILSVEAAPVLERLGAAETLLVFDFDGTLAPLVVQRDQAQMRDATHDLLYQTARRYPCAIVSGRARFDVAPRLEGIPIREIVGNHGLELAEETDSFARQARSWLLRLRRDLGGIRGLEIEDKGISLSIHYRSVANPAEAVAAITQSVDRLEGVRVVGGSCVVNLLPEGGPAKGAAVGHLQAKLGCRFAIFVGDDETDEDVFRRPDGGLLTIRVGESHDSRAAFFLKGQDEIDELLLRLVRMRPGIAPRPTRAS